MTGKGKVSRIRDQVLGAIAGVAIISPLFWLVGTGIRQIHADIQQRSAWQARIHPLTCDEARRTVAEKWQVLSSISVQTLLADNDPIARNINAQRALDDQKEHLQDELEVEMTCTHPGYRSSLESLRVRLEDSRTPATAVP
jgi:hypothetical protein